MAPPSPATRATKHTRKTVDSRRTSASSLTDHGYASIKRARCKRLVAARSLTRGSPVGSPARHSPEAPDPSGNLGAQEIVEVDDSVGPPVVVGDEELSDAVPLHEGERGNRQLTSPHRLRHPGHEARGGAGQPSVPALHGPPEVAVGDDAHEPAGAVHDGGGAQPL